MRRSAQLSVIGALAAAILSTGAGHAAAGTGSLDSGSASPDIALRNLRSLLMLTGSWDDPCGPLGPCWPDGTPL